MRQILSLFFLLIFSDNAFGQKVSASLDRSTTSVGESVTLAIVCTDFSPTSQPVLPSIPGLRFANAGTSRQFQFANGKRSSSYTLNYLVTPLKPGNYSISPIQIRHETSLLRPNPLKLRVLPAGQQSQSDDGLSQYAFVRLMPGKREAYVGEIIPVEIQLYYIDGVNVQLPQLTADGFNIAAFPEHKTSRMQKGNRIYQVLTFQTAATPLKAGALKLGPVKQSMVLRVRKRQSRRSPFNDPFDGFFDRYQQVPVELDAEAQPINVKALPVAGQPKDFNGAVGRYTMQAKASPLEVTVGDPITVSIQISGQGAVESLNLPKLDWPGFKSYEPSVNTRKDNPLGLLGTRAFEQVVIPESDTIDEVPRIEFPYFDPVSGQYRVLSKGPFPLNVKPGEQPITPVVASNSVQETERPKTPLQNDIANIKHHLGSLSQASPLITRPSYWLLQSIPLLLWLGAMSWRRQTNSLASNPKLRRERQVNERTRTGLAKLEALAESSETGLFHTELADLLREQIGLKLDIPAEGITGDIVHSSNAHQHISAELRDKILQLFTASDQASYAGSQTTGELKADLDLLKALIDALK